MKLLRKVLCLLVGSTALYVLFKLLLGIGRMLNFFFPGLSIGQSSTGQALVGLTVLVAVVVGLTVLVAVMVFGLLTVMLGQGLIGLVSKKFVLFR